MNRLFFVRHGLTEANVNKIFTGIHETKLTAEGIEQARTAGKELKDNGHTFDLIIASPLSRAKHTAEYIADQIGYPKDRIELDEILVERKFGPLEGKNATEFYGDDKKWEDLDNLVGVETNEELQGRAKQALEMLESRPEESILVVSHGAFGRALRRAVIGLHHSHEYSPDEIRIGNCEIIELI